MQKKRTKRPIFIFIIGIALGIIVCLTTNSTLNYTSTDEYCARCHVHQEAIDAHKLSSHVQNNSGTSVQCVECHLPPKEHTFQHYFHKAKLGLHDLWAYYTKDSADFNWAEKRELDYAKTIVFNESCIHCHTNLYPKGLSREGGTAHLYYEENHEKLNLHCINCHLDVGHHMPNYSHKQLKLTPPVNQKDTFSTATPITSFTNFTEQIPGTTVTFNMIAIPGGSFTMGAANDNPFRNADEYPQRQITLSPFFMGETEVSWDEFWAFYLQTSSEGRIPLSTIYKRNREANASDAISGPTPPFGLPSQGWGEGSMPAITMSHYAATTYCQWLSLKTGKHYRLPTEAEWEYATRANTQGEYFFEGSPNDYTTQTLWNKWFGADTSTINQYAIYAANSSSRTASPDKVKANPFGLKNMLGNVAEYCSDFYSPNTYTNYSSDTLNPKGPSNGEEYVIRGGYYMSDAMDLRITKRDSTQTKRWLLTDPQQPKSIWWLSDFKGIGFRVVCDYDGTN